MRRILLSLVLVASACSASGGEDPPDTGSGPSQPSATVTAPVPATTTTTVADRWHLAWQPTALVEDFADDLGAIPGVDTVSMVRVGDAGIVETAGADGTVIDQPSGGFVIPVEVHAFGASHAEFIPIDQRDAFVSLADDEIILGSTSATLRRLDVGATITFAGNFVATVAGIVDDEYVGDAEIVTTREDPGVFGAFLDKYAVFRFDGERSQLEEAVGLMAGEPVTVRAWGEVLVFRHGDSVRSQAAFKARFGEFTIRPTGGGFEQGATWRNENLITETIPLLGSVTCHREFVEMLRLAMQALEEQGRGDVIRRSAFRGCWNARFIAGRQAVSHHSFGAAADINFFESLDGPFSPTDPDLLVALYTAGMTSGHIWVNPDPGHFEWFDG